MLKGVFFSESVIHFSKLQNKYSKSLLILSLKFEYLSCLLLWVGKSNFKFRIVIWNIFLEIWQRHRTFWKEATFRYLESTMSYPRPKRPRNNSYIMQAHFKGFSSLFHSINFNQSTKTVPVMIKKLSTQCLDFFTTRYIDFQPSITIQYYMKKYSNLEVPYTIYKLLLILYILNQSQDSRLVKCAVIGWKKCRWLKFLDPAYSHLSEREGLKIRGCH